MVDDINGVARYNTLHVDRFRCLWDRSAFSAGFLHLLLSAVWDAVAGIKQDVLCSESSGLHGEVNKDRGNGRNGRFICGVLDGAHLLQQTD